jgi:hypothetical protein
MRRAILVILDGLRRDLISAKTTPNLAAFAKSAETFTDLARSSSATSRRPRPMPMIPTVMVTSITARARSARAACRFRIRSNCALSRI